MKNIIIPILGLILSLSISSCSNTSSSEENNDNHDHTEMADHNSEGNSETLSSTSQLVDNYLKIKNALVSADREAAASAGEKLAKAATDFDLSSFPEIEQQNGKEILEVIKENAEHIAKSEIEHQIEHFESMDNDFIDLLKISDYDKNLYQQYCPMYNDKKGGTWLSDSEEIKNPLFKSKMLSCGSIKQTIAGQ
ncbi:MAG: DUF3347 domain-containing protein [Cytophagales bacterium]|nr:DUF3347 domain-containing protein [Cytophagales bacterium]